MKRLLLTKLNFYVTFVRLILFLFISLIVLVILFPVSLPFCGGEEPKPGSTISNLQFVIIMVGNALAAIFVVRLKYFLLFLLGAIASVYLIDLALSVLSNAVGLPIPRN
jgi:hypothetical protein